MDNNQKTLPPIARQSSKQKQNLLAKRLYKNNSMKKLNTSSQFSYLKNINPDSSILASTMTRNNSSKNLLIPSVSLKRNKDNDNSQRSLQITQGKILISKNQQPSFLHYKGDLKYQLQKTASKPKTLFKKLPGFDSINESKIVPDELLGCSSDQESSSVNESKLAERFTISPKSQQSKLLKGFKSKEKKFFQEDETLTPNDFIQLVQEDGSITNQFCYLKKMSHPYDLRIVQFQSPNQTQQGNDKTITKSMIPPSSQYITISSRGVSYFSPQNSRFVPLQRWKKQAFYFNKLMKLEFFVNFRLLKSFAKWKKHIRKTAMKSTSEKLRNELMLGDKYLRRALLSVKQNCFIMQTDINYCKLDDCDSVMQFQPYKSCQQQFIQNQFQRRIVQTQDEIKNSLLENMSQSMKQFKEQNKISTSNEGKGIPLLIGDQKNLDMPYTKQATLRTQQEKFKKFLKLVEFMIVDSKLKMMKQSTEKIVNKVQEQNESYEKQVINTDYKLLFKGKQYIKCSVKLSLQEQSILLKPTRDDLNQMFEQLVNKAIVKLCRGHKRISNDEDILQIIYDSTEKAIRQPQTNLLKVIIMSDDRQEKIVTMINSAINKSYSFLQLYCNKFMNLVDIYFDNLKKLQTIDSYETKDHQMIAALLEKWKNQLLEIGTLYQEHQSAIFLLDFQQFKHSAMKCVTECSQKMKRVLPEIFYSTTQNLLNQLEVSQEKIRVKPVQIEDFIEFQKNKAEITAKMDGYSDKLAQINCVNIIIKGYSAGSDVTNLSRQQREINKIQTRLNALRTKLEEAEMNTKSYENHAQQLLKAKIPLINQNIIQLYLDIKNQKFSLHSDPNQVAEALKSYKKKHKKIQTEIKQLQEFQLQLSVEEFNEDTFKRFTFYFNNYQNIWRLQQQMTAYQTEILKSPWTGINIQQALKSVEYFINQANKLKKIVTSQANQDEEFKIQLNDIDVISYVFLEAKNLKPLIETVQCLRDKSLGEKEWKQIKTHFQKINKQSVCRIIEIENKTATLQNIQQEKVTEELDFIHSVVLRSKKQLQIHNKMTMVNKFWIESSANNAAKNLAQNFQKYYWDIITEIDQKITVINGISEDTTQVQAQQLRQNIAQNKQMFDTLRILLVEWQIHQRYLHYFEPIFMNSYWKSNTKELKLYTQAQINWKKLLKQCKDYSLKRWASNQKAIATIRQNIILFEELKKAVEDFLTVKRDIFPKFYFLSNQELLHVLLTEKQVRNIQQHINKVFTCIKSLDAKQPGQILVSTEIQSIQTKFSKAFNTIEVEQIFKMLQQGIKSAVKSNLRNCMTNFQKDDFVKKKWVKDHLLQSLLFIQKSQYTKIIEYDYMGPQAEDLSQYIIYQNSQIKELQSYVKQQSDQQGLNPPKIETLILQQILHRDITQMLLNNRITDEESYEWQKHIRCYYSLENAFTKFFTNQIQYGYELVNLVDTYPYVSMSDKETIDLTMALKLKHLPVINGRQNLVNKFAKFNAKYFRNVVCQKRLSQKYLLNVCYGTYLEGSYVQLQEAQNLTASQLSVIANFLKQVYSAINRKDKTFNFGWKKNSLNFYSGIVFRLSDVSNFTQFESKMILPTRSFEFSHLPYNLFVNIILEARKNSQQNLGLKVMKAIEIINQLQNSQIISFHHIKNIFSIQNSKSVENLQFYIMTKLQDVISDKIISPKRVMFYKKVIHSIFYENEKDLGETLQNESSLSRQKGNKQRSDFKYVVNSLVQITEKKSILIVAGSTQSGKISVISEAYKQKVCRGFEVQVFNLDTLSDQSLFGCYVKDLWREGILIQRIKQLSSHKQQWIVFEGEYNKRIEEIILRLNNPLLQLSNGEEVFLSSHWKFIFSIFNLSEYSILWEKNINIISSNKFINVEESMYLMMQKRIKSHFENIDNYNQLSNMCINKVEKILDLLKTIGFKNDYLKPENILRYFINILDALLGEISTQIKESKQFSKGIQKIFIWSIYWCIGSALPQSSANKYQKSIFQLIKTDIERSLSIAYLKLQFQTPLGHLKKIKNNQINYINGQLYLENLDIKSKANFVQLMIKGNTPIILTGKTGSGKSKFMEYLQFYLNSENYAYLPIRLRKQMNFSEFKDILFKKTRISIKHTKKKCFCSSTNKKLIIFIDDFNLLDLGSQIGHFLVSCIKNGFYYDISTNEKIYVDNISFVVAENDTYQNRMENRFLKYFKPIYINEVQLKDIAEIYKQQFVSLQYSKEIFQSSVSLHNYVMNLQSSGQISREVPFSHKNALRIFKTISEYNHQKQYNQTHQNNKQPQKRQNIAKIWAYIAEQQYLSYGVTKQAAQKIEKQIKNLLNLIIQNSTQKPKPVPKIKEILNQLSNKNQLVKTDVDYENYYEYLAFLTSLSNPHNLLTINQPLPQFIKQEMLSCIANFYSLNFVRVNKIQSLKDLEFKNTLIYLKYENFSDIGAMISEIMNNLQCRFARYVIDLHSQEDWNRLVKQIPSIFQIFHIYKKKQTSSKNMVSSKYNEWLQKMEKFLSKKLNHSQTLTIISNALQKQRFFKSQIQKKKKIAQNFTQRYLRLQQDIQKHTKQIQQLNENFKNLHSHEEQLFIKKKQDNELLVTLKNTKAQNQQEEQRLQKLKKVQDQIHETQNELKNLKNKKKEISEKTTILQAANNLEKQVQNKLHTMYENFVQSIKSIEELQKILDEAVFCLSLYYYGIKNNNIDHVNFIEVQIKQGQFDINRYLKVIFDINPSSITKQILIWAMQNKQLVVKDRNGRFLRQIRKAVPKLRVFEEIHSLSAQHERIMEPIVYVGKYDPIIQKVKNCTFITKQYLPQIRQNLIDRSFIIIEDSVQNQKENIKAYLYKNKQRETVAQIHNFEEEIYRMHVSSWEDHQRIISQFLDPKAHDLKHLKSILYFQNDRVQKLEHGLFKAKQQLERKYHEIVDACTLFKRYFSEVEKKFGYFIYNEDKFLQLCLSCISTKASGIRTQKRLLEMSAITKKSLKTLKAFKSKAQLETLRETNKENVQSEAIPEESQVQAVQNSSVVQLKLQEQIQDKDNTVEAFKNNMVDEVLRNLSLALKGTDFLEAYSLLTCFLLENQFNISINLRKILKSMIKGQKIHKQELEKLKSQIQSKFIKTTQQDESQTHSILIFNSLKNLCQSLKQQNGSLIEKAISLCDMCLNKFFDDLLQIKYDIEFFEQQQNILIVSNQDENPYELIERQIFSKIQNCNWCYLSQTHVSYQKILQIHEKCSVNWIVLVDQTCPSILGHLKHAKTQKNISFVLLFTEEQKFINFKRSAYDENKIAVLEQLIPVYAQNSDFIFKRISDTYLNYFSKLLKEDRLQIQQIARIVLYEQTNRILKQIYSSQSTRNSGKFNQNKSLIQFYFTKIVNQVTSNLKNIDVNNFIKIVNNLCFANQKDRQNIVLREAKKIVSKNQELNHKFLAFFFNQIIEEGVYEGSSFVIENGNNLIERLTYPTAQQILNLFVPKQYKEKYPLDSLYFEQKQKHQPVHNQNQRSFRFDKEKILQQIQQAHNKMPCIGVLQSQSGKKEKLYFKQIIKHEIKKRINVIKRIEQNFKRQKRNLQVPKILSSSTQKYLTDFINSLIQILIGFRQQIVDRSQVDTLAQILADEQKTIQYLQNFYHSKDTHKIFQPAHFRDPYRFLKFYLLEINPNVSLLRGNIQARYLTDKQRQTHVDEKHHPSTKNLFISQVSVKNGKFDPIKNSIESNEKNQPSKIVNVQISFSDKDYSHLTSIVPIHFRNKKLADLHVINKVKDDTVWKDKLYLQA